MQSLHSNYRIAGIILCLLLTGFPGALAAQGDPKLGAANFGACAACHSIEPGRHMTGPSLAGLWGRKAGSVENFLRYSDAMKNSGVTWDEQTLDKWLQNPSQFIPHNEMTFPGIKEHVARQEVIAYLKAVSEGKAPSVPAQRGGMMGGGDMPNLKKAEPDSVVKSIRHCRDTYFVTTADGKTHKVWEFNLRFKTDSSANGPRPGKPAVVGVGMRGDRVAIVFAAPLEFGSFVKQSCQ